MEFAIGDDGSITVAAARRSALQGTGRRAESERGRDQVEFAIGDDGSITVA